MSKPHVEETFESEIVEHLVENGYRLGHTSDYDRERALLSDDVIGFVQDTQPKRWKRVAKKLGPNPRDAFLKALKRTMDKRGSLEVLRHGVRVRGVQVKLAFFRPAHGLNPDVMAKYNKNRLTVVRQLYYDPKNENSLDVALFLNGVPVVTAELKMELAGQTVVNAKKQYKYDRDPRAPIFRFKQRALVHFAVDSNEAFMTTKLTGKSTFFLPFNKGYRDGSGNPPVEGKHRTHYLWEEVWERHSLLQIIGSFVSLQEEEKRRPGGETEVRETMFFPRYHQLDCVRKLVDATTVNGPGENYLIQHSTGSGKSMSIAWLTHQLQSLHDADDRKVFDSVIVITDRLVLDKQLQETIYQLEHKEGVVKRIHKDSTQLANALEAGAPIIITTLHKFPYVTEKIEELPGQNYAVVVDEAHSSQSGEMAAEMKKILSGKLSEEDLEEFEEFQGVRDEMTSGDVYSAAFKAALFRGPRPNLSFYAFTATPKYKTLKMFGHTDEHGDPDAFHHYTMKQAIEEGFILDTLQYYTTYDTYFGLVKKIEEDKRLDKKKGSKALARFLSLHPHNVGQKTEIIVEHFQRNTREKIGGQAKAMVVCGSRLHAVRYKLAFDRYIREHGYDDLGVLVAFSDTVTDPDTGKSYTEEGMNDGIKQAELPRKFNTDAYRFLIVANKYQTGFDQPLLHTMYVDKRLAGIQAVQTLSRLNRQADGKDDTFVLDFVNERQQILESFKPFYERTTIDEDVDPQQLYDLQHELREFRIYQREEVEAFAKVFFKDKVSSADNARLNSHLDPAVDRFKNREEEEQDEFRAMLNNYLRLYGFMAQVTDFGDAELEMLYVYGRLLARKLPRRGDETEDVDITDDVALKYYRIQKNAEGAIQLEGGGAVKGPHEVGTGTGDEESQIELSRLVDLLNDRFGTEFTEADQLFFDQLAEEMMQDESVQRTARVNSEDNFRLSARKKLERKVIDRHQDNAKMVNKMLKKNALGETIMEMLLKRVYEDLHDKAG
ncbi:MAG: type I restriction endonuclease subunit R [Myxococcota bacterium]